MWGCSRWNQKIKKKYFYQKFKFKLKNTHQEFLHTLRKIQKDYLLFCFLYFIWLCIKNVLILHIFSPNPINSKLLTYLLILVGWVAEQKSSSEAMKSFAQFCLVCFENGMNGGILETRGENTCSFRRSFVFSHFIGGLDAWRHGPETINSEWEDEFCLEYWNGRKMERRRN